MYNYFIRQKQSNKIQQQTMQLNEQHCASKSKKQSQVKLIKRFIDRTVHGYERIAQYQNAIVQFKNKEHQFKEFDKKKNIGPPSFYYKSRNQRIRIKDAEQENKCLDDVPFKNPLSHIFREDKSNKNFKFTPYDSVSRIIQHVQSMKTNEVPTSWDIDIKHYNQNRKQQQSLTKSKLQKGLQLHDENVRNIILPSLHVKLYPKSLISIQNNLEVGVLKHAVVQSLNRKNSESFDMNKQKRTNRSEMKKSVTIHQSSFTELDNFTQISKRVEYSPNQ